MAQEPSGLHRTAPPRPGVSLFLADLPALRDSTDVNAGRRTRCVGMGAVGG